MTPRRAVTDAPPLPTEHAEQCQLIEWAKLQQGAYPELAWLYAIPNGGYRHPGTARKLHEEGTQAGIPDLHLAIRRGGYSGLWLEMKRQRGGVVSPDQRRWIDHLNSEGYLAVVCHGFEDARVAILDYLEMCQ